MVGHHERYTVIAVNLPAEFSDGDLGFQQSLRGESPERQNDLRTHELDLPYEVRRTRGHFVRQRIPVTGRTMLEDVGNKDVVAPEGLASARPNAFVSTRLKAKPPAVSRRGFLSGR